jgi:hypothetical protein
MFVKYPLLSGGISEVTFGGENYMKGNIGTKREERGNIKEKLKLNGQSKWRRVKNKSKKNV